MAKSSYGWSPSPSLTHHKIEPPKKNYGMEFGGEEVMIVDVDDDEASKFSVFSGNLSNCCCKSRWTEFGFCWAETCV